MVLQAGTCGGVGRRIVVDQRGPKTEHPTLWRLSFPTCIPLWSGVSVNLPRGKTYRFAEWLNWRWRASGVHHMYQQLFWPHCFMTIIDNNIEFILNLAAGFCLSFIGSWKGKRPDLPSYRTWPWKRNGNHPPCAYRLSVFGWWFILVFPYLCCLAGFMKQRHRCNMFNRPPLFAVTWLSYVYRWSWKIPCLYSGLMGDLRPLPLTAT